jgi:hypothetical protein
MTPFQFMGDHPLLTVALAYLAYQAVTWPFRLVNRWIRHRNIAAAGWAPFHLDADGDVRTLDEDDIEALKAARSHSPTERASS